MIARTWHGKVPQHKKEAYFEYLLRTGLHDYCSTKGNLGLHVLQRDERGITHFFLITLWDSFESIKKFAGEQYEQARYYPEDIDYLLELEPLVEHYEVLDTTKYTSKQDSPFQLANYFRSHFNHTLGHASWIK